MIRDKMPMDTDVENLLEHLTDELENFHDIVKGILPLPGEVPMLKGLDIYGRTMPLNGMAGGDHIIYVDFKQRYDLQARIAAAQNANRPDLVENLERCARKAGIVLIDVSGHQTTDALLAAMLHQAFLLGAIYELDICGQITSRLFENLNTRFYNTSSMNKFLTMIYGEITEDARFRFLSAAHPLPVVFSRQHDRFMDINKDLCTSFPPIGTLPSEDMIDQKTTASVLGFKEQYKINEWEIMGDGDILLLYSDGLMEHGGERYFPDRLEDLLRAVKQENAKHIWEAIRADVLSFSKPVDDISIVVIKRV